MICKIAMANVLPKNQRKALKINYILRFATITSIVFSIVFIFASTMSLAVYVEAKEDMVRTNTAFDLEQQIYKRNTHSPTVVSEKLFKSQIQAIKDADKNTAGNSIQRVVFDWEKYAKDIVITSIQYSLDSNPKTKKQDDTVRVSGIARNRSSLNAFVQELRSDNTFTAVSFPVSDLLHIQEIPFSVKMMLNKK